MSAPRVERRVNVRLVIAWLRALRDITVDIGNDPRELRAQANRDLGFPESLSEHGVKYEDMRMFMDDYYKYCGFGVEPVQVGNGEWREELYSKLRAQASQIVFDIRTSIDEQLAKLDEDE